LSASANRSLDREKEERKRERRSEETVVLRDSEGKENESGGQKVGVKENDGARRMGRRIREGKGIEGNYSL